MKNVTVPVELLRRWLCAEARFVGSINKLHNAFPKAIAEGRDVDSEIAECIRLLPELIEARRPFEKIALSGNPSREFVKAVIAEASSQ